MLDPAVAYVNITGVFPGADRRHAGSRQLRQIPRPADFGQVLVGLERDQVQKLCREAGEGELLVGVNFKSVHVVGNLFDCAIKQRCSVEQFGLFVL